MGENGTNKVIFVHLYRKRTVESRTRRIISSEDNDDDDNDDDDNDDDDDDDADEQWYFKLKE